MVHCKQHFSRKLSGADMHTEWLSLHALRLITYARLFKPGHDAAFQDREGWLRLSCLLYDGTQIGYMEAAMLLQCQEHGQDGEALPSI